MKFSFFYTLLTIILSFVANCQTIQIYKTVDIITIDGDLTDWKKPFLGPFVSHNSGKKATQNTFVSLSWNDENLYIAYRCNDSNITGENQKKDSEIYKTDDLVELFIDPDGDGKNYVEIGVNAFSTHYDMLIKCISSNCGGWQTDLNFVVLGMETVSKINPEGFSIEIKIPFSSLEMIQSGSFSSPKIGTKWKGNAFRIDYGNTIEYLSLKPYNSSKFGFHQPKEFAVFEFTE